MKYKIFIIAFLWTSIVRGAQLLLHVTEDMRDLAVLEKVGVGESLLHSSNYEVCQYVLLAQNPPLEDVDNEGFTPLARAIIEGNTDIAILLINYGADLHKVCWNKIDSGASKNFREVFMHYAISCNAMDEGDASHEDNDADDMPGEDSDADEDSNL